MAATNSFFIFSTSNFSLAARKQSVLRLRLRGEKQGAQKPRQMLSQTFHALLPPFLHLYRGDRDTQQLPTTGTQSPLNGKG